MNIILIAILAFAFTLIGGFFALRFKDKLHLIMGFSAGAVIGVAFFDLIPEALEFGGIYYEASAIIAYVALGFVVYLLLDRLFFLHLHNHSHGDTHAGDAKPAHKGMLGAASILMHSFIDGVAVGLAFQASTSAGIVVAAAVLVHNFSDGINTVGMILKGTGNRSTAYKWLLADAAAPALGILSTLFFTLPEQALGIVLALFSGFFLYLGASDLIPESHHAHPKFLTTFMTLIGMGVLYAAITIAGV